MAEITIRNLTKSYEKGVRVIDGLDLTIEEGEFVSLLGPSGCGKTTTLRCVAGLERPDGGEILIGGTVVSSTHTYVTPAKRNVGLVFQSYALWPHLTVAENVGYPLRRRKQTKSERRDKVMQTLDVVGLAAVADRPATSLSGGQQQRVALARAIVGSPAVLLFDEPLSNLDAQLRTTLRREVRRIHDRAGVASLFVTHDQAEATEMSDRVLVMRGGSIEQMGAPRDIHRSPRNRFVAEFVGYHNFLSGLVSQVIDDVVTLRVGDQDIHCRTRRQTQSGDTATLAIRPKDLLVHRTPPGDLTNTVPARLRSFIYAGDELRFEFDIGGVAMHAVTPETSTRDFADVPPGPCDLPVYVELPPDRLVLLTTESASDDARAHA